MPDFLAVGHITKDLTDNGWRAGGSVAYAACQAARLGLSTAVVTSCASDIDPTALLPDVEWLVTPSDTTTTFENRYAGGARQQRLVARARDITADNLPGTWLAASIILLAPVANETLLGITTTESQLVGLCAQGFLRRTTAGPITPVDVDPAPVWLRGDAVFVSTEDVTDSEAVAAWQESAPLVVLTRGRLGCTIWDAAGRHDIAALPADEVDPTGAGDIFATALLIRMRETHDTLASAQFASAAAALAVTKPGLDGIATRDEIEARLRSVSTGAPR